LWSGHAQKNDLGIAYSLGYVDRKTQESRTDSFGEHRFKAEFVDWAVAPSQLVNLVPVDVVANDVIPQVSEADPSCESNVTRADDREAGTQGFTPMRFLPTDAILSKERLLVGPLSVEEILGAFSTGTRVGGIAPGRG